MSGPAWRWDQIEPGSGSGAGPPQVGALRPGQEFGGYQILEALGEGGMGRVYRARDAAGREVALKTIKNQLDERRRARFRREGELASRLSHPGILRVLGGGEVGGVPLLVYDLVANARALDEVFRAATLRERVTLLRDAARAVGHAHAQGVVHRDLKPENLLVDGEGRLRVADFGLATDGGGERLTLTGAMLGTPYYMAPEQHAGDAARVGPWSDVWALGVILYQALTGELPFPASSWSELQAQVLRAAPEPPRNPREPVPAALSAVCLRALQAEPRRRYANADALADELEAWLEGRPTAAGRGRRSRRLAGALLALGLIGAAGALATRGPAVPTLAPPAPPAPARPAPSAPPSPAGPAAASAAAAAAWREVEALPPATVLPAAWAWLARYPQAADAPACRALLERERRRRPLLELQHPSESYTRVRFQGEDVLLTYTNPGLLRWSLPGGEPLSNPAWDGFVRCLTYAPDGDVLVESHQGLIARYGPDLREPPRWATRQARPVPVIAADPAGRWFAIGRSGNAVVELHDQVTGQLLRRLQLPSDQVAEALAATRGGLELLVLSIRKDEDSGGDGHVLRVDPTTAKVLVDRPLPLPCGALQPAPDGSLIAVGSITGHIWLLEPEGLTELERLLDPAESWNVATGGAHSGAISSFRFSGDGRRLLSTSGSGGPDAAVKVKEWDLETRELVESIPLPERARGVDLSPSEDLLAVGMLRGRVQVWIRRVPGL